MMIFVCVCTASLVLGALWVFVSVLRWFAFVPHKGTVAECEIREWRGEYVSYSLEVLVEYEGNNTPYRGSPFWIWQCNPRSLDDVPYRVGDSIVIYLDPYKPQRFALNRATWSHFAWAIVFVIGSLVGLAIALNEVLSKL
jgi:hypothetical protein